MDYLKIINLLNQDTVKRIINYINENENCKTTDILKGDIAQTLTSLYVKKLCNLKFLERQKQGREIYNKLTIELLKFIEENKKLLGIKYLKK